MTDWHHRVTKDTCGQAWLHDFLYHLGVVVQRDGMCGKLIVNANGYYLCGSCCFNPENYQ